MNTIEPTFLGTGWSFPPEFMLTDVDTRSVYSVKMLSGNEDINSSLDIIFATALGERVMRPTFGSDLSSFVFQGITQQTLTLIKAMITEAINYHEPRIQLLGVEIIPEVATTGMILITITYLVITINTRNNYVYPFYYQEGTNLIR